MAQACDASNTPLFEDDPYRDLVYDACDRRPVCADLKHAPWMYQGSFSKRKPPGGLFFWLKLNHGIDTRRVLPLAIDAGVAFMPGEPFLPFETTGCGQLRLNFSHAREAQADEGLKKLAALIRSMPAVV